jgi:hypothetical protein
MNEQYRTGDHENQANGSDEWVRIGAFVDDDDDTEACGGKIFARNQPRHDDVANRDGRPTA